MNQAYYSGISGVLTHQYGLDVNADNLANVNTVGFKASTAEFSDLFSKTLVSSGPTTDNVGVGSKLSRTSTQMQNGTLLATERFNDLAIGGNGWFGVQKGNDTYYTRAGNFVFDEYQKNSGDINSSMARLVTTDGKYVMGTMLTNFSYNAGFDYGDQKPNGVAGAFVINNATNEAELADINSQTKIELPTRLAYPVEPTTKAEFFGNIGRENLPRTISANAVSPNNEINRAKLVFSQHFEYTQQLDGFGNVVLDSNGNPIMVPLPWDGVTWDVEASVTSNDGSKVYDLQHGTAVFSGSGGLESMSISSLNNDGQAVAIDLGSGFNGVYSIDGHNISGSSRSNGVSGGTLKGYGVNSNGVIVADFSNGRQSAIGRVAIYHFQNDQGLNRAGDVYFQKSNDSGEPIFWRDASGNIITGATIYSNKLENSNVRLDVGLTDMIIMQRAYQANAKVITTGDELVQKALQMHR